MVELKEKKGQQIYVCEACSMAYPTKTLAQKCEAWCNAYHSCNIDITRHAL